MLDQNMTKTNNEQETVFGDIVALISSAFLSVYLTINYRLQNEIDIAIIVWYNFWVPIFCSKIILILVY